MAEPTPGAPDRGSRGPRSATAATFQVNDSTLKDLHTTWRRLIDDVKEFNKELQNLQRGAKTVDQIAEKLGALGLGGAGSAAVGGRMAGMSTAPSRTLELAGAAAPSAGALTGPGTPPPSTSGTALAGGSSPWPHRARVAGGIIGGVALANASFFDTRMQDMSDADLFFNQQAQNTGYGYRTQEKSRMRDLMFGAPQSNGRTNGAGGLTGYQSPEDAIGGASAFLGAVGGRVGGRGWAQLREADAMSSLTPDAGLTGAAGSAAASLYDPTTSNRLMMIGAGPSVGTGGALQSPSAIYQNIINTVYRGKKPSAEAIRQGMQPGAHLYISLTRGLGLTPDAIQQFERYAIAQANLGGNERDTMRAMKAASRLATGGSVSKEERRLINRAGLADNIRTRQNEQAAAETRKTIEAGREAEQALEKGFHVLAQVTDEVTSAFAELNEKTRGLSGNVLGGTALAAGPVNSILGAMGGIGGAAMTWQVAQQYIGGRRRSRGGAGGIGGVGDVVGDVTGVQPVFVTNWPGGLLPGAGGGGGGGGGGSRFGRVGNAVKGAGRFLGGAGAALAAWEGFDLVRDEVGHQRGNKVFNERKRGWGALRFWEDDYVDRPKRYTGGGKVPGNHNRDDVPILATPGEVVVPKGAVTHHGGPDALMRKLGFRGTGGGGMYAGGGEVTGDTAGLNAEFLKRLRAFSAAVGMPYHVGSGHRSLEEQAVLYDRWMRKVPGQAQAAKPGSSNHNYGLASDGPRWGRYNPEKFGLHYPMNHEPWHIEPFNAKEMRGGAAAAQPAIGTPSGGDGADAAAPGGSSFNMASAPGVLADEKSAMAAFLANANNPYGIGGATKTRGIEAAPPKSSGTDSVDPTISVPASHPNSNVALGQRKAAARGWTGNEWDALFKLWQKESGWRTEAANPTSAARGIAQTMMSVHFGKNWKTDKAAQAFTADPNKQIDWGLNYIAQRYNSPSKAWAHSQKHNWYDVGAWETDDEYARLHRGEMVVPAGAAKKIRQMVRDRGQQVAQPTMAMPQQGGGGSVQVSISMPVQLVGKATPQDARHLVGLIKSEMEQDDTLAAMGSGR